MPRNKKQALVKSCLISFKIKVMAPTVPTLGTLHIHLLDLIMWFFVLNFPINAHWQTQIHHLLSFETGKALVASLALHRQTGYAHTVC